MRWARVWNEHGRWIEFLSRFAGKTRKRCDFYISKQIYNLIKKFGLETIKHMKSPIESDVKLTKDENSTIVDPIL